jgi:ankyrin repeat protein
MSRLFLSRNMEDGNGAAGGCDVDGADGDGATPLYAALDEGQEGMAELLLAAGASPDIGNADIGLDNTLLAWAASRRRLEQVQLLLRHGADPNRAGKSGMYPLHMAARAGGKEVLQALLQSGADTTRTCATHPNCAGVTALQLVEKNKRAVAAGCLEVLRTAAGEAS